jgi:hypothetical protein
MIKSEPRLRKSGQNYSRPKLSPKVLIVTVANLIQGVFSAIAMFAK